jgi:hypothetical protein
MTPGATLTAPWALTTHAPSAGGTIMAALAGYRYDRTEGRFIRLADEGGGVF